MHVRPLLDSEEKLPWTTPHCPKAGEPSEATGFDSTSDIETYRSYKQCYPGTFPPNQYYYDGCYMASPFLKHTCFRGKTRACHAPLDTILHSSPSYWTPLTSNGSIPRGEKPFEDSHKDGDGMVHRFTSPVTPNSNLVGCSRVLSTLAHTAR